MNISIIIFSLTLILVAESYLSAETSVWLGEISSIATKSSKKTGASPGSVSVVLDTDIEARGVQTADQALNTTPGVFNRRGKGFMDTSSALTLRGIPGQKRTLILFDGMPMNDAYTGAVSFGGMQTEDIERVEVARGPFSGLYGGNAMGGVVNFISRRPNKREMIVKTGYGGALDSSISMESMTKSYISYGDKIGEKIRFLGSFGYKRTEGYPSGLNVQSTLPTGLTGWSETTSNKGLTRYIVGNKGNNGWQENNTAIKSWYDISDSEKLKFSFSRTGYDYFYGAPETYLKDGSSAPVWTYGTVKESSFLSGPGGRLQNSFSVGYEKELSNAGIKASVGVIDIVKSWYISPGYTAATTRFGGPGKIAETPAFSYTSQLQATFPDFSDIHFLTGGVSHRFSKATTREKTLSNWKDENSAGALTYKSSGKNSDLGLYLQDEIKLHSSFTVYLSARMDWWKTYDGLAEQPGVAGYPIKYGTRSDSAFSPKGALVYKPLKKTTLRASSGKSFRSPTVYELHRTWNYYSTVYEANPDLKPETVISWDLGIDQNMWFGAKISAVYFENNMKNLIYRQTITPTLKRYVNAGKAFGKGWEFEAEQIFEKGGRVFANLTLNEAEIKENSANIASVGKKLVDLPTRIYSFGGDFKAGRFGFSGIGRYVGKRYGYDDNSDTVNGVYGSRDPYFTAEVKTELKVTDWVSVSLSVFNMFDKEYYDYYLAPGRSWFAELVWKL